MVVEGEQRPELLRRCGEGLGDQLVGSTVGCSGEHLECGLVQRAIGDSASHVAEAELMQRAHRG